MSVNKIKFTLLDGTTDHDKIEFENKKATLSNDKIKETWLAEDANTIKKAFNNLLDAFTTAGFAKLVSGSYVISNNEGIYDLTEKYVDPADFAANGKTNEIVKSTVNADGTTNSEGSVLLYKTATGVEELRSWKELSTFISAQVAAIAGGRYAEAAVDALPDTATDQAEISALWNVLVGDTPKLNDHFELILEDFSKYILYTYDGSKWIKGVEKDFPTKAGTGVDITGAKDGDILSFDAATNKMKWIDFSTFTSIKFISTWSKIPADEFNKWYFIQDTEGALGTKVNDKALVYVMDGSTRFAWPTNIIAQINHMKENIDTNATQIVENWEKLKDAIAIIPAVYPSGNVDPVATVDKPITKNSIYFNSDTKKLMNYDGTKWIVMADLSSGFFGTLKELYDVENGVDVPNKKVKVLNLEEIAELVKDQRDIDKNFLASFKDELTYVSSDKVVYKDTTLDIETLEAAVQTNGSAVTYSTLIHPYDRINQEQANFEATFEVPSTVQYMFVSNFKAVKFTGTAGQTYKWETVGKFENGHRVSYVRFSGTAVMETSDSPTDPTSWTTRTMPYDVKLSDLMDAANRNAIVTFTFPTLPTFGTHFMTIEYLTSTYYVETRFAGLIRTLKGDITELQKGKSVFEYPTTGDQVLLVIQYPDGDKPAQMKVGDEILISIDKSKVPSPLNDTTPVALQDLSKVSNDPVAQQASFELVQSQANANQGEKDLFKFVRRWSYFKDMIDDYYLKLVKGEDFDGKTMWIPSGWQRKPAPEVEEAKNYVQSFNKNTRYIQLKEPLEFGEYDVEIEWKAPVDGSSITNLVSRVTMKRAGTEIVSKPTKLKASLSGLGFGTGDGADGPVYFGSFDVQLNLTVADGRISAIQVGEISFYDSYAGSNAHVNVSGADKEMKWTTATGPLADALLNSIDIKFITKAGSFVKNTDISVVVDPNVFTWVNVGAGHGDQVFGFDDNGKPVFREWFNKAKADVLYEPKTFDFSGTPSAVNLNTTGGKRYLIINQPAEAPNTPIDAYNKLKLANPASPQDNDQVTYGSDLIWIYKNATDIMEWHEIKENVKHGDIMVIKHLSNGHWQLVKWEIVAGSANVTEIYNAIEAEELARIDADKEIWNHLSDYNAYKTKVAANEQSLEQKKVEIQGLQYNQNAQEEDIVEIRDEAAIVQQDVTKAKQDIDALKANSISVPHLDTSTLGGKTIDEKLKENLPSAVAGDEAWVGTNQAWQLYTFSGTVWEDQNTVSSHTTSGHDATKVDVVDFTPVKTQVESHETYIQGFLNRITKQKIAIGELAGANNQGDGATAFGYLAGNTNQGNYSMAFGYNAGTTNQGDYSTVIGYAAGTNYAAPYSVIVGANAAGAKGDSFPHTIIISSTGTNNARTQKTGEMLLMTPHAKLHLYPNANISSSEDGSTLEFNTKELGYADLSNIDRADVLTKLGLIAADITNIKTITTMNTKITTLETKVANLQRLSGITVDATHIGKFLKVKADRTIEFVDLPHIPQIKTVTLASFAGNDDSSSVALPADVNWDNIISASIYYPDHTGIFVKSNLSSPATTPTQWIAYTQLTGTKRGYASIQKTSRTIGAYYAKPNAASITYWV